MAKTIKNQTERKYFKRSIIAACVMAATAAHAQAQDNQDPALLEEVVVYGIKQSLQNAQDIKREASTVKDVITSSDIGALPDKSLSEALSRVPGVAIERFQASDDPDHFSAEGTGVVIRGLTRVSSQFNGRDTFSASGSRGLNFQDVPPSLVGTVEVIKNLTADVLEGGIAGSVNLITAKPFDSEERIISGSLKGSYGSVSEDISPDASILVSDRWTTNAGEFGALLSASASNFKSLSSGVQIYPYYTPKQEDLPPELRDFDGEAPKNLLITPAGKITDKFDDRDRLGLAGSFQWANPSETILATADFIHSDSSLAWTERFVEFGDQPFGFATTPGKLVAGKPYTFTQVGEYQMLTEGTITGPLYVAGTRYRETNDTITDSSLKIQFTPNENLTADIDFQNIAADADEWDNVIHAGHYGQQVYIDLRDKENPVIDFNGGTPGKASYIRSAMDHALEASGNSNAFQANTEYKFDEGFVTSIKGGLRFSERKQEVKDNGYNWGGINDTWADAKLTKEWADQYNGGDARINQWDIQPFIDNGTLTDKDYIYVDGVKQAAGLLSTNEALPGFFETYDFGNNYGSKSLNGTSQFLFPNAAYAKDIVAFDQTMDAYNTIDGRVAVNPNKLYQPSDITKTTETRNAAYVRMNFSTEDITDSGLDIKGNIGLRYITYKVKATGAVNFPTALPADSPLRPFLSADVLGFANGGSSNSNTVEGTDFDKILPSLNLSWGVSDDVVLRFAASRAVYFPDFADIRNSSNLDGSVRPLLTDADPVTGERQITGAVFGGFYSNGDTNPFLKPETANQFDMTAEWYFADVGSLTATVFRKKINDAFRQGTYVGKVTNDTVAGAAITQNVAFAGKVNSGVSRINGWELAYQQFYDFLPEPWSNMGMAVNYTYVDGDQDQDAVDLGGFRNFTGLGLEGQSTDNYNIQLMYETESIESRIAYTWRSKYLLNSEDVISFSPIYSRASGFLDASFYYTFNDNLKVGLEANNLLDEMTVTEIQYDQNGVKTPRAFFAQDRRLALVIRASL